MGEKLIFLEVSTIQRGVPQNVLLGTVARQIGP